jgi:hypothetical protein
MVLSGRRDGSGWSAGVEGLEAGDCGGDLPGPGPAGSEAELEAAAAVDDAPGAGEEAEPQPFRFPSAGFAGEGEDLHPGEQVAGQGDDLAPHLVLVKALEGKVAQARVLRAADPVLASGPAAVA